MVLRTNMSTGLSAVDIATHLPQDTLSGVVYLCSFIDTYTMPGVSTARCGEIFSVLINPEASFDAVQKATLDLGDAVFDLGTDLDTGSEADLKERRLRRWGVQNAWLGSTLYQTTQQRRLVASRAQDIGPLSKLGADGFPVLAVNGAQDALLNAQAITGQFKERFKNLKVVTIEKAGGHAPFHENHEEVMEHIGSFAKQNHRK